MKKRFVLPLTCLCLLSAPGAFAATAPKASRQPAAPATAPVNNPPAEATQSDVIGSKEAPGVFNIVPWKDKVTAPQKKEVNTSILRETLQPLDRDVLLREIEFHRNTEQQ